ICGAPTAIALTNVQGTLVGSSPGDTGDGVDRVKAATCGGTLVGSGKDALFSFTLERTRDVTVTLSGGTFDGLLRAYTQPCVTGAPLAGTSGDSCANAGGAGASESLTFAELAKGTYYVAVDGVGAGDNGTFSVNVSATCNGTDQLRIVELGVGSTDYTVLRNTSDCQAHLDGLTVRFDDALGADLSAALPDLLLEPGEQVRIQENLGASTPGVIGVGSIEFGADRGGTVALCRNGCATGADVIDALAFADGAPQPLEPPPALPAGSGFSFPVGGITPSNLNDRVFVRVALTGKNPTFTGADFCTGRPGSVFGMRLDEVFVGDPDFVAIENHADCALSIQPFRVRFDTAGSAGFEAVLDARVLVSGARVYLSEPPNRQNDVNTGVGIPNVSGTSGSVRLCRGSCATPGTTVDAVVWAGTGAATTLPGVLSFSPDALPQIPDETTSSYLRTAISGQNPRFLATDWAIGNKSR
ncbi:MAG: PPC domain-containing protein, partial [Deltaproteobacteria bacterium]|nr:PPC domain-containing protein [Deltaproteobacteria bacterium]